MEGSKIVPDTEKSLNKHKLLLLFIKQRKMKVWQGLSENLHVKVPSATPGTTTVIIVITQ